MATPVSVMSNSEKVKEAILRSKRFMPAHLAYQVEAFLTPENLALMTGTVVIWAGSHFFGVGEVVDVGLLLVGAFFIGWSIESVVRDLIEFGTTAVSAKSDAELDHAAQAFASALVTAGVTAVMAILLRRGAKQLQAARGATVSEVARLRTPGLANVEQDAQAGQLWRKPTVTGDPAMAPGTGQTWWFGDVEYSTAGSATEQQLARVHELVHSFLRPRLRFLRQFRARLNASAYTRSAILKYLEEGLAETVAQLSVRGIAGLMTGIRFPIANGYLTLQQLVCEGAEIGTIVVGTQRFSVQFIVGAPASAYGQSGGD
jgi:hypothetical protein